MDKIIKTELTHWANPDALPDSFGYIWTTCNLRVKANTISWFDPTCPVCKDKMKEYEKDDE